MTRDKIRGWSKRHHANPFPVPHPSWCADPARGESDGKLSAKEFWSRLGL